MSTRDQRLRLAQLLERVAAGEVSPQQALLQTKEWTDVPWREWVIADAYHGLQHFQIDADVRGKDPQYSDRQRQGLMRLASRLREQ